MKQRQSPTVRRRQLARELRRLRKGAGMPSGEAARKLGWAPPKLTRFERADRTPSQQDLEALLNLYGVTDPKVRHGLATLRRESQLKGWWCDYQDVFGSSALPDFEAEAVNIRTYEAQVIPGLLQVPEYIEAVFRGGAAIPNHVVQRHVEARLERQRILEGHNPTNLYAIIDEAALRRMVGGPEVMERQLDHLLHMAVRHHVDIRVLPFEAGAHAAMTGSFMILEFPDSAPPVACADSVTSYLIVEEQHHLDRCYDVYGLLQGAALLPDRSVDYIKQLQEQVRRQT